MGDYTSGFRNLVNPKTTERFTIINHSFQDNLLDETLIVGVTAEYPATSSILRSWLRGTRKELKSRWRSIFTSWLRGTRYAERIKVKMAKYLYKLATRYAEIIKVNMAKYLYKLATRYAVRGKN